MKSLHDNRPILDNGDRSRKRSLPVQTTTVIDDRFAKIASAYTGGACSVQYSHESAFSKGSTIFLPCVADQISDDGISRIWGFVNAESARIDVREKLLKIRIVSCSEEIFDLIPPLFQAVSFFPGESFADAQSHEAFANSIVDDISSALAAKKGFRGSDISEQIFSQAVRFMDILERFREQEAISRRWPGAADHLREITEEAVENWLTLELEELDEFFLGLFLRLRQLPLSGLAPVTLESLQKIEDLVRAFHSLADFDSANGFFDSTNMTLAMLGRLWEESEPPEEPPPEEPPTEEEPEEDEDQTEEGESEGDESSGSDAADTGSSESESSREEQTSSTESSEGGSESGGGDEEGGEGSEEGEGDSSSSGGNKPFEAKVGMRIRLKETGRIMRISEILDNGSFYAEEVEQ